MRHTGRQLSLAFVVLALGPMGMGGFGGGRETGLPQREFRATFTDVDGTRVEATRVTAGGDTNLEGEIGRGRLRVPFDNIERIRFEPAGEDRDRIKAVVVLRDGADLGSEPAKTLQDFVKSQIAPYKYPRSIEFADALPRTATGKLQRFRLREGS